MQNKNNNKKTTKKHHWNISSIVKRDATIKRPSRRLALFCWQRMKCNCQVSSNWLFCDTFAKWNWFFSDLNTLTAARMRKKTNLTSAYFFVDKEWSATVRYLLTDSFVIHLLSKIEFLFPNCTIFALNLYTISSWNVTALRPRSLDVKL